MTDRLDFWARRKAAVAAEAEAEVVARETAVVDEAKAELEEKSDAEILDDLGLPDPESLKEGDDFSAFMSEIVPDRIRRRALRLLWRTNPVLANVDGLIEYGEDFTDSATVIENLQTTYQVGKGMLAHLEKIAADQAADDTAEEVEAEVVEVSEEVATAEIDEPATEMPIFSEPEEEQTPRPRRMTFTYESEAV